MTILNHTFSSHEFFTANHYLGSQVSFLKLSTQAIMLRLIVLSFDCLFLFPMLKPYFVASNDKVVLTFTTIRKQSNKKEQQYMYKHPLRMTLYYEP